MSPALLDNHYLPVKFSQKFQQLNLESNCRRWSFPFFPILTSSNFSPTSEVRPEKLGNSAFLASSFLLLFLSSSLLSLLISFLLSFYWEEIADSFQDDRDQNVVPFRKNVCLVVWNLSNPFHLPASVGKCGWWSNFWWQLSLYSFVLPPSLSFPKKYVLFWWFNGL